MRKIAILLLCTIVFVCCKREEIVPYLSIDKTMLSFNKDGTITDNTLEISSNTDWKISGVGDDTWFILSQESGKGKTTISVTVPEPNLSDSEKSATIRVISLNDQTVAQNLRITQAASDSYLNINNTTLSFNYDGTIADNTLVITSNTDWQITGIENWFTLSQESGNGDATIAITVPGTNLNYSEKSATITIKSRNSLTVTKEVEIIQAASDSYLNIDKTLLSFREDGTITDNTLEINSNTDWQISGIESWFTLSQEIGNGNIIITVTVPEPNFDDNEKSATITIKSLNNRTETKEVKITQIAINDVFACMDDFIFKGRCEVFDTNRDGKLSLREAYAVREISVGSRGISSLKGIEYFAYLTYLNCNGNKINSLDVSRNTALTRLYCSANNLNTLDVSKNLALIGLYCIGNNLNTLDVSKNTALIELYCYDNKLNSLDVSKNTALTQLSCANTNLSTLDVSENTALTILYCSYNNLSTLDLSKNPALIELSCGNNKLRNLDVSKHTALRLLWCSNNTLSTIDANTALIYLDCSRNNVSSLDVSRSADLTYLNCRHNKLATLDVSRNPALFELYCYDNKLSSLDLSKNTSVTYLYCYDNPDLKTIYVWEDYFIAHWSKDPYTNFVVK